MYEQVFVFLLLQFVLVTLVDMMTPLNSDYLHIAKEPFLYWALRVVEILLIPCVVLFYLEGVRRLRSWSGKMVATCVCVLILFGVESCAVKLQLVSYASWRPWWSLPAWLLFLIVMSGTEQFYRKLLLREGGTS